jgi:hypothetical protein
MDADKSMQLSCQCICKARVGLNTGMTQQGSSLSLALTLTPCKL